MEYVTEKGPQSPPNTFGNWVSSTKTVQLSVAKYSVGPVNANNPP